ncbi:hypothetical protein G3O08_11740 [Cryomorpha ignava]|uniref:Outer membrane beta-barrel protein n=1 Tax=Cryomorpha ignava TaxID=101383 RepID=A0A7K3WRR4_9FLAO|nr:hypothetical protein [Cryomorpha ignava]NEN24174.1 hypothetical protein [Cryomorpha ignava]
MKKFIIISVSLFLASPMVFGQDDKTDYSQLFPEAGDFSLGLDMSNVIQFIGNSFSANGESNFPNNSLVEPSTTSVSVRPTIYGRYFLTDDMAIRLRLGLGVNNTTSRVFVYDDVANMDNPLNDDPLTYDKTVDEYKQRNSQVELGIGLERRKNLWRMQGYGGAEVFGAFIYNSSSYTYGNAMSATNQTPTTYNFVTDMVQNPTHRTLETTGGNVIRYGGGLYAGADFFITKNISMGVEYNLFFFGSFTTEETGIIETYKLDQVYSGETKLTPTNTGFQTAQLGTFNINIYF